MTPSIRSILALALLAIPGAALAATGGPDAAGYTWADSDTPGIDVSVPGYTANDFVPLGFAGDDALIRVTLPVTIFPTGFPYYGNNYPAFWLSSNGWLSFVDPGLDTGKVPANVPNTAVPNGTVAFYWDDWILDASTPTANGGPNTANDGYTMFLQLEPRNDPGQRANLYVTLFQTGVIKVVFFGTVAGKGPNTVIGLENATASIGLPYMTSGAPQNGASFREFYAIQFFPKGNLNCNTPTALTCNQPATGYNNNGGGNNVRAYNCAGGTFDGNEKVFSLNVARTSNLTLTLNNTDGRNRALFFMRACSEFSGCWVGGATTLQPQFVQPGNYLVVVDGVTATDNGNFTLRVDCTDAATGLPCNTTRTRDTTSGVGIFSNWSCAFGLDGPEKVYEVNVTGGPATLRASIANPSTADINVLISDAAGFNVSNPTCILSDPAQATVWGAQTGTYLVTVDSTSPATSATYDISVECSRKLVCPSPARVLDLTNPTPTSGDTTGKTSFVDEYYCSRSAYGPSGVTTGYTGPEDIYEFTITAPSIISFVFDSANPDLRMLILRDCYEGSCVMEGGCGENLAPGTYRLVVDGQNGAAGPYTFTPFVVPANPYNFWYQCPEGAGQSPDSVRLKTWNFDSGNFCGTGCDFSLFAVVECGTEFHVPLFDDETGHMAIFDVLQQRYVDLTAVNNAAPGSGCEYSDTTNLPTKTTVNWDDNTCSAIPCPMGGCGGGNDCRTNNRVMDVSFRGTPNVCGVYKIDFINWGGFVWQAFANCTGTGTEQFYLYRDLCSALANYHPLPEVGIANITVDNAQCSSMVATGTITLENVGCLPAAGMEITIEQAPPLPPNPQVVLVSLLKGQQSTVPWSYNLTALQASLIFKVDPARRILECSENLGSTVQCGTNTALRRERTEPVCPASCTTSPDAGADTQICENESLLVDGSASTFTCVSGTPQYQWEDSVGTAIPGCTWSATPTCNVPSLLLPPGPQVLTLKTRCAGDNPPCERQASVFVNVIPNVTPPALGNVLRAYRDADTVRFSWAAILGSPISGYRLYKDDIKWVPATSRLLVGGADLPWTATTTSDEGAVPIPPNPVAFYQIVGVSCFRDLEGPY